MKIEFGLGDIAPQFGTIHAPIKRALSEYFTNRKYGNRELIIFYVLRCLDERRFDLPTPFLLFNTEFSVVECSIDLNYATVSNFTKKYEFVRYVMNCYLDRSMDFSDLAIDGFDINLYCRDLEDFFINYINSIDRSALIDYSMEY